jgi:hypothetical protein
VNNTSESAEYYNLMIDEENRLRIETGRQATTRESLLLRAVLVIHMKRRTQLPHITDPRSEVTICGERHMRGVNQGRGGKEIARRGRLVGGLTGHTGHGLTAVGRGLHC